MIPLCPIGETCNHAALPWWFPFIYFIPVLIGYGYVWLEDRLSKKEKEKNDNSQV